MKNKKVVVCGHVCIDITPQFLPNQRAKQIGELLRPGKLLNVGSATVSVGGAVANTGLALLKFGNEVILMGKIADDSFGNIIEQTFREYGAEKHLIHAGNESTSYSMVIAPPGIDRMFLHHPGTNDTFCYGDLDFELISQAGHFHFGYPSAMRNMYVNEGSELLKIFQKVKQLGLTTSLDLSAVEDGSEASKTDWAKLLERVIPYVDFFVPSIEELGYMMDRPLYEEWNRRAGSSDITMVLDVEKDIKPLADRLIAWGAKCVLIKCGAPGMYLQTADAKVMAQIDPQFYDWGGLSVFEQSYVSDCVLSGTGAGDTSIAAFLKAAIDGYPVERCLQLAAGTGASCVTAYDTLSGLRSFEELIHRIENGWEKNSF